MVKNWWRCGHTKSHATRVSRSSLLLTYKYGVTWAFATHFIIICIQSMTVYYTTWSQWMRDLPAWPGAQFHLVFIIMVEKHLTFFHAVAWAFWIKHGGWIQRGNAWVAANRCVWWCLTLSDEPSTQIYQLDRVGLFFGMIGWIWCM